MSELEQADDLAAIGDHQGAVARYRRTRVPPGRGAAVAWRLGREFYLHGDIDGALTALTVDPVRHESVLMAGDDVPGSATDDAALVLAWRATARWVRGDLEGCARDIAEALALAVGDQALAAVHTARAMLAAAHGDRRTNERAYEVALHHARRAGDELQELRIRNNRGSRLVEEGDDDAALVELDAALAGATPGRHAALTALALVNRGEALLRLGRPREALSDVAAARMLQPSATSPAAAYALALLGEVHLTLGQVPLARLAYEEAVRTAAANGHAQALQLAVAGLTTVLAQVGDVTSAQDLLTFSRHYHGQMAQVQLELAEAAVAAVVDPANCSAAVLRAAETAQRRRDRRGLARALEIARRTHSGTIQPHQSAGHRAARAHVTHPRGELAPGALADARPAALLGAESAGRVAVRCLGVFAVTVAGLPVEARRWGSRKPRDLLKMLAVARGLPVPREVAAQRLWPEAPPEVARPRLAVAVSTLRRVLDHGQPGAPALVADRTTLRLDLTAVDVDLDRFLTLARRAEDDGAALLLAEECWTGEVLPDDVDEDWTAAPRDEAREAYRTVLRVLAAQASEQGDPDGAVRRCLRLLDLDPVDEDAHVSLIAALAGARRHGEARRRHDLYVSSMSGLGLAALPLASILASQRREVG